MVRVRAAMAVGVVVLLGVSVSPSIRAEERHGTCRGAETLDSLDDVFEVHAIERYLRKILNAIPMESIRVPEGCKNQFEFEVIERVPAEAGRCPRVIARHNEGVRCPASKGAPVRHYTVLEPHPRNGGLRVIADKVSLDDPRFWPMSSGVRRDRRGRIIPDMSLGAGGDVDEDGVPNGQDLCLFRAEDDDGLFDIDGCPDRDRDGDGVADVVDICRIHSETENGFQEADGCPDHIGEGLARVSRQLVFAAGTDELSSTASSALHEVSLLLAKHAGHFTILVEGYSDVEESSEVESLSTRRAKVGRAALVEVGVDEGYLVAVGRGRHPGEDIADLDQNRRLRLIMTQRRASSRFPLDAASYVGSYDATHFTLDVAEAIEQTFVRVSENPPDWLGPPGSRASCYAWGGTNDRLVMHFQGARGEFSIILMRREGRYRGLAFAGAQSGDGALLTFSGLVDSGE